MITCADCLIEIKGNYMRTDKDESIHIRCMRKRIESQPGFVKWNKVGVSMEGHVKPSSKA